MPGLLSRSCDIITSTTPGVSLGDWQRALQEQTPGNEHRASSPQADSYFTRVRTRGDGAVPGRVNIYAALGTVMLLGQILLKAA